MSETLTYRLVKGASLTWTEGDANTYNLGHFTSDGTGAVERTSWDKMGDFLSVKDFGAVGDDSTNDAAAFAACYTEAIASGKAMVIPGGTYKLATKFTISDSNARVIADGKVKLHFTGTGNAVEIGNAIASIYNVTFGGECGIEISGNASCTNALYMFSLGHCDINIRARNCTGAGLRIAHGVANTIRLVCSANEEAFTTQPTNGIYLEEYTAGNYCADNTFVNPIIEGVSGTGIYLEASGASGNVFQGGTSEGNNKGVEISTGCRYNQFIGLWMEANTTSDIEISEGHNTFRGILSFSSSANDNIQILDGEQSMFIGGYLRTAACNANSAYSIFIGCETSDHVNLGIKGTGTKEIVGCIETNTSNVFTSKVPDEVGEPRGTWTPSFSSAGGGAIGAITTQVGTYCRVGKLCFIQAFLVIAKGTLGAGQVSVTGLPFAARNTTNDIQYIPAGEWSNVTLGANYTHMCGYINPNGTTLPLIKSGTGVASAAVNVADFAATMSLTLTGVYEVE